MLISLSEHFQHVDNFVPSIRSHTAMRQKTQEWHAKGFADEDLPKSGEKRKVKEKVRLDDIMIIDIVTHKRNENEKVAKKKKKKIQEEKKGFPLGEPQYDTSLPSTPEIILACEEVSPSSTDTFPTISKGWWMKYVFLAAFEKRMKWCWKKHFSAFRGAMIVPREIFEYLFVDVQSEVKETSNKIRHILSTEQHLKEMDKVFDNNDQWRKKSFYHKSSNGEKTYDGQCCVVLMTNKKLSWAANSFIPSSCLLEFEYEKQQNEMKFKGVVEGRNGVGALRF